MLPFARCAGTTGVCLSPIPTSIPAAQRVLLFNPAFSATKRSSVRSGSSIAAGLR
jgi:hypothetical protein